jgi:hypothetical protein
VPKIGNLTKKWVKNATLHYTSKDKVHVLLLLELKRREEDRDEEPQTNDDWEQIFFRVVEFCVEHGTTIYSIHGGNLYHVSSTTST